jgi:hypothetical protein
MTMLLPFTVYAQEDSLTFAEVDQISYTHYIHQEWQPLIDFSERALASGIDFYHLRLRAGIACYQLEAYRSAIIHLEKAASMNPFESDANQYLYWCYLYTGREEEAVWISKKLNNNRFSSAAAIQTIYAESGLKISSNTSFADNLHYGFVGLQHHVKHRLSLFHGFTYLQQETHWGNYTQYQYYIKARIPVTHGWYVTPATHIVQLNAAPYNSGYYLTGNMGIEKHTKHISFTGGYTYSNFFNDNQHLINGSITWFPLDKQHVWLGCSPSFLISQSDNKRGIIAAYTGYSFINHSVLTLTGLFCNTNNFTEANGFMVNNTVDIVKHRYTVQYTYPITPKKHIYMIAQHEMRDEFFYQQHLAYYGIIIGFKYKP